VAQALLHMHELDPPLIHRDVKSPNILLTASLPDARARLADLGCTKVPPPLLRAKSSPRASHWHVVQRLCGRCTCGVRP
jgi:serine/threonine protein kinase